MKAMVYHTYGSPDVSIARKSKAGPSDNQVLDPGPRCGPHALDVGFDERPPLTSLASSSVFPNPKITRPGRDVAGESGSGRHECDAVQAGRRSIWSMLAEKLDGQSRRGLRDMRVRVETAISRENLQISLSNKPLLYR